ncbi:MAG: 3-phosphoserine/phosphohydroxythreonine transaminase [Candidatus Muiribacterium halophilum]|uniref:Phosphoserine aminotransferase n=1 Tax=Muiribacterium halophilum TaxID=2053465 RepID=A0A2N5ZEQ0_MUIH1|nr:MAG: 3-phosphoserine/phosphohydroxythreonine transaminase [Candidatus Muirbacterium halophilum]
MDNRVFNFSAGPATLPESVLKTAQEEFLNWHGCGMSVMEMSHRSKEYGSIIQEAEATLVRLLNIPDTHKVLFLQGGATLQFAMAPMNLMTKEDSCDYIIAGNWGNKAFQECEKIGLKAHKVASSEEDNFTYIPEEKDWDLSDAKYVHYTSNNTIFGTCFNELPEFDNKIAICDMSSDFLSRPVDISKFGLIYAGAQKNAGPAGVTIAIIRKDLVGLPHTKNFPTILNYSTHVKKDSMHNTPPSYSIYICGLVFKWVEEEIGGLDKMYDLNKRKAQKIYDAIDNSNGFYRSPVVNENQRSLMNIPFVLPTPELDAKFIEEAGKLKMLNIKGYRTVGGIRASIYNAHPMKGVDTLVNFMEEFRKKNS